ncbi:DNA replication/repair protein RecF [Bermanella marisrubri]|uniref:DNA replication and repair protein RecF n=1 Tax=Bermanella marisrubri TaxID=207949 RepID=Q1MXH8_9GAMM|nr:DNA replication/repair protein RecF [Bermanella marisrubri]EAT10677.1 recombination protein F [Oceanobacter sp. RED65] [Bermanella marisrubri]QIZ82775.1 DNA replication/repair protein RecF [Bermanella marisrubri]
MAIELLMLQGVRNLSPTNVSPSPLVNLIYGENGSGKTSFLEAIYYLAYCKSFRTHKQKNLIQHGQNTMTGFCQLPHKQLGVERNQEGQRRIKLNGVCLNSAAELASVLPIQLLDPTMFRLLEGSPQLRREYIDWGVFHVEPQFFGIWKQFKRAHQTRNALLRAGGASESERKIWHSSLSDLANQITSMRIAYLERLKPLFDHYMARLNDGLGVTMSFYQGWKKDQDYYELLESSWKSDIESGYTKSGPQRADLRIKAENVPAMDVLSRGQQKMVVCALKLAQADLYKQVSGSPCIFLVDDLAAELDINHRKALCRLLEELKCQVFVTAVESTQIQGCWSPSSQLKTFHVEHGTINQE